ncbi:MAG: efflux RND transporter periplasmic adaptor subunit [Rhizobiales bacterium]|nr:efflux RND transporter periplasmic adaptor subunit [Hyphomicrobiales bacterium]
MAPVHARSMALLIVLSGVLAACGGSQQPASAPPPPAVTVAPPEKRTIIDRDEYVGRFVAVDSVEVRARVSGYLDSVHFADGANVKQGELLFTIDKRPFQNAEAQAGANLDQARANLAYAEADLVRAQQLVRERTVSEQVFQQRVQAEKIAEAALAANEAALRQAKLDLTFTELQSPISGRIGDRRVSPGNLVTGGTGGATTLLATIVSVDPIRFEFTFDEAAYLRYKRISEEGRSDVTSRGSRVEVDLKLLDEKDFPHKGHLDFIDNVISTTSGTIRGRAVIENKDGLFTPGMFARVRVPASPPYEALTVPDSAIGSEQARKFILTVDQENTVHQKYVTPGALVDGLRVIKEGLAADDRVIVDGLMRARPGQKVTPEAPKPAAPKPQANAR